LSTCNLSSGFYRLSVRRYTAGRMETRELNKPGPGEFPFEITGGALCLDFANTVDNRPQKQPRELLHRFADLLAWSRQAGALAAKQAAHLERVAARHPHAARATLRSARELREALFRIFSAAAAGRPALAVDIALFNAAAASAFRHLRIGRTRRGFAWQWQVDPAALDRMLWPVLRSAADLLTSRDLQRVRECAAHTCGWLFLDRSKNGSRRWCNMQVCGNRAKARRFYKRHAV
jgi:predicted RNA-binding Zn ribbon-like protein